MMLQQIALGGAMIAMPLYLQVTLEYNAMQAGLSLAPLSLTMFAVAMLAGKRAGDRRPASIIRLGFALAFLGMLLIVPVDSSRRVRLGAAGSTPHRRDPGSGSSSRSSTTTSWVRSRRSVSARQQA